MHVCAPHTLQIVCPKNKVIEIEQADFGRVSKQYRCNRNANSGVLDSEHFDKQQRRKRSIFRYSVVFNSQILKLLAIFLAQSNDP